MTDFRTRILSWAYEVGEYRASDIIKRFEAYEAARKEAESAERLKHIYEVDGQAEEASE